MGHIVELEPVHDGCLDKQMDDLALSEPDTQHIERVSFALDDLYQPILGSYGRKQPV